MKKVLNSSFSVEIGGVYRINIQKQKKGNIEGIEKFYELIN